MKRGKILLFLAVFFVTIAPALMAQTYNVRINCNVKGADLYVDGNYVGKLPGEFPLKSGKHIFKMVAPGYQDQVQNFRVTGKMTTSFNLEPAGVVQPTAAPTTPPVSEYKVSITSNVANADIFIDGVLKAKTPATILLKTGNYNIKLMAAGYTDAAQQLAVNGDAAYNITLQPSIVYYALEVTANLRGARVFVNGKDSGEAPVNLNLPEGNYIVKVVKQEFADFEQSVQLNKATKINAILQPMTATVKIIIPQRAINKGHEQFRKIEVYLDDQRIKDFEFAAPRGQHRVRLESGFLTLETMIDFIPGKIYEIKPGLNIEVK